MRRLPLMLALLLSACGGGSGGTIAADVPTNSPPIVARIAPPAAAGGDSVAIFGLGFSLIPENNIVAIGDGAAAASDYALIDPPVQNEIESLTFTVPTGIAPDTYSVIVLTDGVPSNTNVEITITP